MNPKIRVFKWISVWSVCLMLTGCTFPNQGANSNDPSIQQTSVAQTVEALRTQLLVGGTPIVPDATLNLSQATVQIPTMTQTTAPAALTPSPMPILAPTNTTAPAYRAGNVVDVTYKDNSQVYTNETFTKTWQITNLGSSSWTANFKLLFSSGDALGGPASQAIGQAVAPGQTINISVQLTAPETPGTYQGNWMLQTESGTTFGIGNTAADPFWVKVVAVDYFAVTAALPAASPDTYSGACPTSLSLTANITSTSAGTVTYYFVTSQGNSSTFSLKFSAAGTKTTDAYSLPVAVTGDVSVSVYIDNPNHQQFGAITIPVTCTP